LIFRYIWRYPMSRKPWVLVLVLALSPACDEEVIGSGDASAPEASTRDASTAEGTLDSETDKPSDVGVVDADSTTGDGPRDGPTDGPCTGDAARPCYTGTAGTQGVGECKAGTQVCVSGAWSACTGEQIPAAETCDGKDNDCNGTTDDKLTQACYSGAAGTKGVG